MVAKAVRNGGLGLLAIIAILAAGLVLHRYEFLLYSGSIPGGALVGWIVGRDGPTNRVRFALWMAATMFAGSSSLVLSIWIPWSVYFVCLGLERLLLGLIRQQKGDEGIA